MKATAITEKTINSAQIEKDKAAMRIMQGDNTVQTQEAFAKLYARYKSPIFFFILRCVSMNKDIARDIMQEVFTKVFINRKQYDFSTAFSTWLYSITNNHVIDYKRKNSKFEVFSIEHLKAQYGGDEDGSNAETSFQIEDKSANASNNIEREERIIVVRTALTLLKNKDAREIIEMIFLDEMPYEKVAKTKGLPLGTVKAIMFRAKDELKDLLSKTSIAKDYGKVYSKTKKWKNSNGKEVAQEEFEETLLEA